MLQGGDSRQGDVLVARRSETNPGVTRDIALAKANRAHRHAGLGLAKQRATCALRAATVKPVLLLLLLKFAKAPGQENITKARASSLITVALFQPHKGAIFSEERLICVSEKLQRGHGEGWGSQL